MRSIPNVIIKLFRKVIRVCVCVCVCNMQEVFISRPCVFWWLWNGNHILTTFPPSNSKALALKQETVPQRGQYSHLEPIKKKSQLEIWLQNMSRLLGPIEQLRMENTRPRAPGPRHHLFHVSPLDNSCVLLRLLRLLSTILFCASGKFQCRQCTTGEHACLSISQWAHFFCHWMLMAPSPHSLIFPRPLQKKVRSLEVWQILNLNLFLATYQLT